MTEAETYYLKKQEKILNDFNDLINTIKKILYVLRRNKR